MEKERFIKIPKSVMYDRYLLSVYFYLGYHATMGNTVNFSLYDIQETYKLVSDRSPIGVTIKIKNALQLLLSKDYISCPRIKQGNLLVKCQLKENFFPLFQFISITYTEAKTILCSEQKCKLTYLLSVFVYAKYRNGMKNKEFFESYKTIGDNLGFNEKTVSKSLKALVELGLLTAEKSGRKTLYTLKGETK